MPKTSNEIMHLIVTRWDGDVVRKEVVRQAAYPRQGVYEGAIRDTYRKLKAEYPTGKYRVDMVSSGSTSPIALQSSSI